MSMLYQDIYKDAGKNYDPIAVGLKGILIEIGKMEYLKKDKKASDSDKSEFCFPSDCRNKSALYEVQGKDSKRTKLKMEDVPDKDFYKEGIYRINKNAKMGQKNKTAIKRLIKSESKSVDHVSHKVFKIHKYKTKGIYDAILKYLRDYANNKYNIYTKLTLDGSLSKSNEKETEKDTHPERETYINDYIRNMLKIIKGNHTQDFTYTRVYKASEFITYPYYDNFMNVEFSGKKRIMKKLNEFNNITKDPEKYI